MAGPSRDSSRSARAKGLREEDEMVHYLYSGSCCRRRANGERYRATYGPKNPSSKLFHADEDAAGLTEIASAFHSTAFVTNLSVAFYMLSMAIFPLFWSSFSEIYGRRTIYLSSFLIYFVFNVLSAESQNIAMFSSCESCPVGPRPLCRQSAQAPLRTSGMSRSVAEQWAYSILVPCAVR